MCRHFEIPFRYAHISTNTQRPKLQPQTPPVRPSVRSSTRIPHPLPLLPPRRTPKPLLPPPSPPHRVIARQLLRRPRHIAEAVHVRRDRTDPVRRVVLVDVRAPHQLRRRHRPGPGRVAAQRHGLVPRHGVVRQRGRGRADGVRARQLREGGLGAAVVAALVHVSGRRLGHGGFVAAGACLGAALADEDGEGEEGEGSGGGGADGDADFGAGRQRGCGGLREGVPEGEDFGVDRAC